MIKRCVSTIVASVAILAFSATVWAAANRVELGTSVPNIPKSLCYQAGSISMEFSAGTVFRSGDVIQYTLNNGVVLCKDIDFYVRLHNGEALIDRPGTNTAAPVSATDALDQVTIDAAAVPPVNVGAGRPAFYDYGFRVKGLAGSQIIQLTVGSRSVDPVISLLATPEGIFNENGADNFIMTFVGINPEDVLSVSIFDEKAAVVDALGRAYLYKDDPDVSGILYDQDFDPANNDPFTYADNTLCIDTLTFDYQGERVEVTPDSITVLPDNKLTFTGEREIARILAAAEYALVTCKDSPVVGNIILGGQGQDAICPPFDFDTGANYCPGTHENNKLIIQALTNPFPVNDYKISLEVKVNGLTGDQGVYIAQNAMEYLSTTTLDEACSAENLNALTFETYVAPGACTQSTDVEPGGSGCTVDCANKVVKATTIANNLGITLAGGQSYLRLGLPSFRYDTSIVKEGDVVSVRLIVAQYPCGTILDEEIQIGTFGCAPETRATTLLYPYFTPANGSYFWSAYAITNISGTDGNVTLYMYESDGDAFTGVVATPVKARTIWTTTLADSIVNPDITWTQTAGTGTPGDAAAYVQAVTTFTADGFGFIAGSPTGESMGYLPRVDGKK
ncbi:hypothetical protein [Desulfococcus sp.]|uniref:hypothetical protein n=1 Tax=Desulfococcus sp. TaxID=2025834 RepID=UPI00359370B7